MVCNREGDREEFVEISLQSDCTLWAEHPQRVTDIKFHTNSTLNRRTSRLDDRENSVLPRAAGPTINATLFVQKMYYQYCITNCL